MNEFCHISNQMPLFFQNKISASFFENVNFLEKNCWAPLNSWGKQRRPPPCTCHLPPCTASQKEAPNTMSRLCLQTCAWSLTGQIINDRCDPMSFSLHWNPFNLQGMKKVRELSLVPKEHLARVLLVLEFPPHLAACLYSEHAFYCANVFFAVHICL